MAKTKIIAIDGACHNNGKVNSDGCGACIVADVSDSGNYCCNAVTAYMYERPCTNQRAELHGLLLALGYINDKPGEYLVVTDSEYIYNAMTKGWLTSWKYNAWIGSRGDEPIKNVDLWQKISYFYDRIEHLQEPPCFYHIKGHVLSIGKVTRNRILEKDSSLLLDALFDKYSDDYGKIYPRIKAAQECSMRINGFEFTFEQLCMFAVLNTMADCIASYSLDYVVGKSS